METSATTSRVAVPRPEHPRPILRDGALRVRFEVPRQGVRGGLNPYGARLGRTRSTRW